MADDVEAPVEAPAAVVEAAAAPTVVEPAPVADAIVEPAAAPAPEAVPEVVVAAPAEVVVAPAQEVVAPAPAPLNVHDALRAMEKDVTGFSRLEVIGLRLIQILDNRL